MEGYVESKGGRSGGSKMTKADLDAAMAGVDEQGNLLTLSASQARSSEAGE